ncbi:TPA: hypothetical protein GXZ54_04145 [bacterium]|nr:hypothetical protein [bacterium]
MIVNYFVIFILASFNTFLSYKGLSIFSDTIRMELNQEESKFNDKWITLIIIEALAVYFSLSLLGNIFSFISVLLLSDLIGLYFKHKRKNYIISIILSGLLGISLYGIFIFLTENVIVSSLIHSNEPGKIFDIFAQGYLLLPVLIIGHHFGIKKSVYTLIVTTIVYIFTHQFLTLLDPSITAFTFSSILYLLVLLINYKGKLSKPVLMETFSSNLAKMIKNKYLLAIMGGLISLAVYLNMSPNVMALIMQSKNNLLGATILTLLLIIAVIPSLIASTLISGYFSPLGFGSTSLIGLLLLLLNNHINPENNLIITIVIGVVSVILGFFSMLGEISLLPLITNLFDKREHLKLMSESITNCIYYLLDFTLISGTLMFIITNYEKKSLTMGLFWCLGLYLINRSNKNKVIASYAAGPFSLILFALVLAFLDYIGLY